MQSRYYDSNICRFINSDIFEISQKSKDVYAGINLFTYCNNDSLNYQDPSGIKRVKNTKERNSIINKYIAYLKKKGYYKSYCYGAKYSIYTLGKSKNGLYELEAEHRFRNKKTNLVNFIYGDKKAWYNEYQSLCRLEESTKGFMSAMLELASVPFFFYRAILNYGLSFAIKNKVILKEKRKALRRYKESVKYGYYCYIQSFSSVWFIITKGDK